MDLDILISILAVVVGFCALCLSLCALGVSIWQGFETRKNYRLSVTPNICIMGNWIPHETNGIIIENRGIGPAKIISFQIEFLNENYDMLSTPNKFIEDLGPKLQFDREGFGFNHLNYGEYLPANQTKNFLFRKESSYTDMINFIDALDGIKLELHYESVYGQSFNSNFVLEKPRFIRSK